MKLSHIFLPFLFIATWVPLFGQLTLPNPGFEQWQADTGFAVFEHYAHLNAYHDLNYGMTQVTAVASPGGTAVRLAVGLSDGGDTINSYLRLGQQCDGGLGGGMNLSEQPDSLVAWIRHDIPAADHANLILIYENNGNMVDFSYCAISGTQTDYYRFACALNPPSAGSFDQISLEIKPGSGDQPIPGG
ncbi:MAG: hypothetical protein AAF399_06805 [Bacteroidota bacterium]